MSWVRQKEWIAAIVGGMLCVSPAGAESSIVGRASVIDGDTIEIQGERVRLHGVDAPESWQKCEDGDGGTRCEFVERDRYKRLVGVCFRADGREVNRWLVNSGNAVDWERYSNGAYALEQEAARSRGAGIWRGKFQLPCEARANHRNHEPSC